VFDVIYYLLIAYNILCNVRCDHKNTILRGNNECYETGICIHKNGYCVTVDRLDSVN